MLHKVTQNLKLQIVSVQYFAWVMCHSWFWSLIVFSWDLFWLSSLNPTSAAASLLRGFPKKTSEKNFHHLLYSPTKAIWHAVFCVQFWIGFKQHNSKYKQNMNIPHYPFLSFFLYQIILLYASLSWLCFQIHTAVC